MSRLSWQKRRKTLGSLSTLIVEPTQSESINHLIVLSHGYGAPGDDLANLAPWYIESLGSVPSIIPAFVFPQAPLSLASEGYGDARAWWNLSIQSLLNAYGEGKHHEIYTHIPDGIDQAREKLTGCIESALLEFNLSSAELTVGGFSQGAMLSTDVSIRGLATPPKNLWLYSGTLICKTIWQEGAARLASTRIVQSHGTIDPILPFATGVALRDLLIGAGCEVEFIEFDGPHTIAPESIEASIKTLSK